MEFEYNDGGRSKYFRAENVGDCVTRAICNATGLDYLDVYKRLKELSKNENVKNHRGHKQSSVRDGVFKETWKTFLEEINWVRVKTMDFGNGNRIHLRDGEIPNQGVFIVQVSKHLTCVRDGVLVDTYDCSRDGDRMVYGYYRPMNAAELAEKQNKADSKQAELVARAEEKKNKELERAAKLAAIKKIRETYKKKMAPYKKKLRELERAMEKEIKSI